MVKKFEVYGPSSLKKEFKTDFTLIQPTSNINLNDGLVRVLENNFWKAEGGVAYLIEINNKKIIHTADSAMFSNKLKSLKDGIDLCFVACFESNFNNYLRFLKKITPKLVIPYHFNPENEGGAKKLTGFLLDNDINSTFLSIGEEFE